MSQISIFDGSKRFRIDKPIRLMGVKDEDFKRVAKNQTNGSLYHLVGDSIVTNCLMAIFEEMLL